MKATLTEEEREQLAQKTPQELVQMIAELTQSKHAIAERCESTRMQLVAVEDELQRFRDEAAGAIWGLICHATFELDSIPGKTFSLMAAMHMGERRGRFARAFGESREYTDEFTGDEIDERRRSAWFEGWDEIDKLLAPLDRLRTRVEAVVQDAVGWMRVGSQLIEDLRQALAAITPEPGPASDAEAFEPCEPVCEEIGCDIR